MSWWTVINFNKWCVLWSNFSGISWRYHTRWHSSIFFWIFFTWNYLELLYILTILQIIWLKVRFWRLYNLLLNRELLLCIFSIFIGIITLSKVIIHNYFRVVWFYIWITLIFNLFNILSIWFSLVFTFFIKLIFLLF